MQFLSEKDSKQWFDTHRDDTYNVSFEIFNNTFNSDSVNLARILFDQLSQNTNKLIWFADWPLYTELQMKMIERFRMSYGEINSLIDTPGHLFDSTENLDALTCLTYSFLFLWDSSLVTEDSQHRLTVSHDCWASFESTNQDQVEHIKDMVMREFGFKLLSQ